MASKLCFLTYITFAKENSEIKDLFKRGIQHCINNDFKVGYSYLQYMYKILYIIIPQMREYSLSIKQKDFFFWKKNFIRILCLIMEINPKDNCYIYQMLLFLQSLQYWEENCPTLFNSIKNNLWLLDDEIGEMYFAILSQAVTNNQKDYNNIKTYYR